MYRESCYESGWHKHDEIFLAQLWNTFSDCYKVEPFRPMQRLHLLFRAFALVLDSLSTVTISDRHTWTCLTTFHVTNWMSIGQALTPTGPRRLLLTSKIVKLTTTALNDKWMRATAPLSLHCLPCWIQMTSFANSHTIIVKTSNQPLPQQSIWCLSDEINPAVVRVEMSALLTVIYGSSCQESGRW